MAGQNPSAELLCQLNLEIETICLHLKEIHSEAADIMQISRMPDAALHLNDVLQATEEATTTILDAATVIGTLAEDAAVPTECRRQVTQQVGRIYEACGFQDISGQRIRKVLQHLSTLETQLLRLSETARGQAVPAKAANPLLSGPQLSAEAPSQADVDRMFNQS